MEDQEGVVSIDITGKATECGIGDKLFASVLIGDLQEAAEKGSGKAGYGTDFLKQNNICWIILRMRLKFDSLPSWNESFKIKTWFTGLDKISYGRDFEILDSNGHQIGKATSIWILADWNTHRPVIARKRPELPEDNSAIDYKIFGENCPKLVFPDKADIAKATDKPVILKYADFSELDRNRHVNNSRYTAWVYDALFKDGVDVSRINEITINYNSEVKAGEKVELYITGQDDQYSVYGYKNGDTKVFMATLRLG